MKKKLFYVLCVLLILFILGFPSLCFEGAKSGLLLWFDVVLPTLLPFMIASNLLIQVGFANALGRGINHVIGKFHLFPAQYSYPLLVGFLFGFPMGSKAASDMYRAGYISGNQLQRLTIASNNISPAFLISYAAGQSLGMPSFAPLILICCYTPGLIYLLLIEHKTISTESIISAKLSRNLSSCNGANNTKAPRFQMDFKIIDACIMNGLETIAKLGGYIILFGIVVTTINAMSNIPTEGKCFLTGVAEVTNGIQCISTTSILSNQQRLIATIICASFGGLCGTAQTSGITAGCPISIPKYIFIKTILAAVSGLMAAIAIYFIL